MLFSALLAMSLTGLSGASLVGPPVSLPTVPGISRGQPGSDNVSRSGGLLNDWRFRNDWTAVSQSYGGALQFASCAYRVRALPADTLRLPAGHIGEMVEWRRIVRQTRGCIGEQTSVAPFLLRTAAAEVAILRGDVSMVGEAGPGLPDVVDGYPIKAVSRCQLKVAPALVMKVLSVRPGSQSERAASEEVFAKTSSVCGPERLGRLTPTVARIAWIDAAVAGALDRRN